MLNLALSVQSKPSSSNPEIGQILMIGGVIVAGLFVIVLVFILFKFGGLWIQSTLSGAPVGPFALVGMALRKVKPSIIVDARIMAVKAGVPMRTDDLEALYLARGDVVGVTRSLIASNKAGLGLTFQQATAINLAGRDVLDAVKTSVTPKVIDCPDPKKGRDTLDAVAMDGIQLKVKARVTVRMNLARLIGGATEETVIARVGEGIVSSIGSAESYKAVLANPDVISKQVLAKGLDAQTAFEIVSIDIADVDVGENVGARLQADQAEANMRMFRAEAEKRRALAVAKEQEMKALDQENRAKVTLSEAEIPLAMASAIREGKFGVADYFLLRNIQADTDMRRSIADPKSTHGHQEDKK